MQRSSTASRDEADSNGSGSASAPTVAQERVVADTAAGEPRPAVGTHAVLQPRPRRGRGNLDADPPRTREARAERRGRPLRSSCARATLVGSLWAQRADRTATPPRGDASHGGGRGPAGTGGASRAAGRPRAADLESNAAATSCEARCSTPSRMTCGRRWPPSGRPPEASPTRRSSRSRRTFDRPRADRRGGGPAEPAGRHAARHEPHPGGRARRRDRGHPADELVRADGLPAAPPARGPPGSRRPPEDLPSVRADATFLSQALKPPGECRAPCAAGCADRDPRLERPDGYAVCWSSRTAARVCRRRRCRTCSSGSIARRNRARRGPSGIRAGPDRRAGHGGRRWAARHAAGSPLGGLAVTIVLPAEAARP